MDTADNKRLVQEAFGALADGDSRPLARCLAPDVRWTVSGTTRWSGTFVGRDAVLTDLLRPLAARIAGPVRIRPHRVVAEGDLVVVEGRGDNLTLDGERYDNTYCWVCRMADGKLVDIVEHCDTDLVARVLGDR